MRHFATVLDQDGAPCHFDSTCCELHVCNRIKAQVSDLVSNVVFLYSIGNLLQLTSTHTEVIRSIERLCGGIRRKIGAPPAGVKEESWKVLSYIFNLESDHHKRASSAKGQMYSDVVAFLSMVNDRLTDTTLGALVLGRATEQALL